MDLPRLQTASTQRTIFAMAKKPGNPNWGKPALPTSYQFLVTEFEQQMERLNLNEYNCAGSDELRRWCERNKNRCYIPEWLLKHWGMSVEPNVTD